MKDKTKNILKTIFLLSIILLLGVVLILNVIINSRKNSQFPEDEYTSSEETESVYKLSVYNGKLAVFILGDSEPIKIYDLFLTSLPTKDAEVLRDGILVYSKPDLQQLIEDFTS